MRLLLLLILILGVNACYYDSVEYLFPSTDVSCDTLTITYSEHIQPILQDKCYTCHSNSNAPQFGSNLKLEDYNDVKALADDGSLLGTISHSPGYPPMPRGGGKLDDCSITQVSRWIDAGAPAN